MDTRLELLRLKSIKKSSDLLSTLATKLIYCVVFAVFFLFFNIAVGLWLGECLGKSYYGFFILAAFYLIVGLILKSFGKKWIQTPLQNTLIDKLDN